jgi:hypothetical protein
MVIIMADLDVKNSLSDYDTTNVQGNPIESWVLQQPCRVFSQCQVSLTNIKELGGQLIPCTVRHSRD